MDHRVGAAVPFVFLGGGEMGPHVTVWLEPRPTFLPSGIVIHLTVWQQTPTSQTDKQSG